MGRYGRAVSSEKMYRACVDYDAINEGIIETHTWVSGAYATPAPAKASRTQFLKYGGRNRTVLRKYMEVAELNWQETVI